ncbi:HIT domain-containing protein [Candidatus Finniella inopinata]|uniref:HIT domain-containing protein n=1 Tax=Candidatus Finniella inopinata TaxID=1696036 RepID=A0A4Q7DKN7_9PROT|nr:HIT domain-containing protein [Candidatus Finniella inopinata]RZI46889.1 HIT domain-containing protein [Candidatus Finniella inopinata]
MTYDSDNIFARILRGEIACEKISEDEYYLAFHDRYPKAPVHVLIIPKGPYLDAFDFHHRASSLEIVGFYKGLNAVIEKLQISEGYRLIANSGHHGGQEVPHYHVHLLAGRKLEKSIV